MKCWECGAEGKRNYFNNGWVCTDLSCGWCPSDGESREEYLAAIIPEGWKLVDQPQNRGGISTGPQMQVAVDQSGKKFRREWRNAASVALGYGTSADGLRQEFQHFDAGWTDWTEV